MNEEKDDLYWENDEADEWDEDEDDDEDEDEDEDDEYL